MPLTRHYRSCQIGGDLITGLGDVLYDSAELHYIVLSSRSIGIISLRRFLFTIVWLVCCDSLTSALAFLINAASLMMCKFHCR